MLYAENVYRTAIINFSFCFASPLRQATSRPSIGGKLFIFLLGSTIRYLLRMSLLQFSDAEYFPLFTSITYLLSNCPCPSANIGRLPTNIDGCLRNAKDSGRIGIIDSGQCPILCPFTH